MANAATVKHTPTLNAGTLHQAECMGIKPSHTAAKKNPTAKATPGRQGKRYNPLLLLIKDMTITGAVTQMIGNQRRAVDSLECRSRIQQLEIKKVTQGRAMSGKWVR